MINKVTKYYDPVIRRTIQNSNLYLWSKLSHERSNEIEIVRIANYIVNCYGNLSMIDVGANIGAVSLSIYDSIKKGQYYAFEGNENFFTLLEKNLRQVPGSKCEKIFLSDKNEKIKVEVGTSDSTGNVLQSSEGKEKDFFTLDKICRTRKIEPNFIKIDTDGYDFKIIRGLTSLLSSNENIVLYFEYSPIHQVLHKVEKNPVDVFKFLSQFGFDDFYFYDKGSVFFARFNKSDIDLIDQITQYCFSKITHYNVLVFHRENKKFKEIYEPEEKKYIEEIIYKNWGERWLQRLK